MSDPTAWGAFKAYVSTTLDDAAAWLDSALPDSSHANAIRLVVPPGQVLLRSLVLPPSALTDVAAIIANRMDALSPWPAAETLWRHKVDADDACRFHVAIFCESQLALWRAQMPEAVRIELRLPESDEMLVLDDKSPRRQKFTQVLSTWVSLCMGVALVFAMVCAGAAWFIDAGTKRKELEILALSPQSQIPGEAALLAGYVSRKASERSVGAVLLHLVRGLPDNAWASSLELKPGHFIVSGHTETLDGLLEHLEADDAIANARFSSSAEKDATSGKFTFSIGGDVLPASTGAP